MKLSRFSPTAIAFGARWISALALLPLGALALSAGTVGPKAQASSHAEAPAIADDPTMDNTDVWAWQDSASTITIVTAWNGVSYASGGPNYRKWTPKEQGVYEIHIDTNGDGVEDVTYQFQFTNHDNGAATFLRVTSPPTYGRLQGPADKVQKFNQTYSVSRITGPRRNPTGVTFAASNLPVAPPNTGPQLTWGRLGGKSTAQPLIGAGSTAAPGNISAPASQADYESKIASLATQTLTSGEKVFVGPRADAFFVDLGPTFDQLKIRTFGDPTNYPPQGANADVGQYGGGHNTLAGKNVEVIALQIPISSLGGSFPSPLAGPAKGALGLQNVGVWASSSRRKVRVLPTGGSSGSSAQRGPIETDAGKLVQVSRLGNPLVNELFIPYDQKDTWNGDEPQYDAAHWNQFFLAPEVPIIINTLYPVSIPNQPARAPFPKVGASATDTRADLSFLFAPDTLKVRVDLATNGAPNGLKPSDLAFVLNPTVTHTGLAHSYLLGRTPADDVVDIYLKAAAGFLLADNALAGALGVSQFTQGALFPNVALGDGVDFFAAGSTVPGSGCGITLLTNAQNAPIFPYLGTPYDGQEARDGTGNGNDYFKTPRHP